MGKHVIVGAGQIGRQLATLLSAQGKEVLLASRSGPGPDHIAKVKVDASDADRLTDIAQRADVIYNCVNPPYQHWTELWPPMASAFLQAAEKTGAVLATLGNLYVYGPVDEPMTEDNRLGSIDVKGKVRAKMWQDMLAAQEVGRVQVTEVRGSDYFGPECRDQSHLGERFVPPLMAGRRAMYLHNPDIVRSWTYAPDVARALSVAGADERAWGRAWHVPTNPAVSARTMAEQITLAAAAHPPRITRVPYWMQDLIGITNPFIREMKGLRYQFDRPFVIDSTAFETEFNVQPTPLDQAISETVTWWRRRTPA